MNNIINKWGLLFLLLLTTPLYAETNYLYVSDIIKKQAIPDRGQLNYGLSRLNKSQYYKDNDIYLNQPTKYQQPVNKSEYYLYSSNNKIPQVYQYPVKDHMNHFGSRIYEPLFEIKPIVTPKNNNNQRIRTHSNVLYVTDVESFRDSFNKKRHNTNYEFEKNNRYIDTRDSIRYVPEKIYSAPKTVRSDFLGVSTSKYRSPVDSYIRHDYNYGGLNNVYDFPYNSLRHFWIFPRH